MQLVLPTLQPAAEKLSTLKKSCPSRKFTQSYFAAKGNLLFAPCEYCASQKLTERNSREAQLEFFSAAPEYIFIDKFLAIYTK
jgi:hypothetical protein